MGNTHQPRLNYLSFSPLFICSVNLQLYLMFFLVVTLVGVNVSSNGCLSLCVRDRLQPPCNPDLDKQKKMDVFTKKVNAA